MSVHDAFYIFRGERVYSYKRSRVNITLYHGKINKYFFVNRQTNWRHCVVFWMPQEEWRLHIWGWTYLLWKRWNNRWPACGFLPRPGETKTLLFVVVVVGCNLVVWYAAVFSKSMVKWLSKQVYFALQPCCKTRWKAMLRVLPPVYCNNQVFNSSMNTDFWQDKITHETNLLQNKLALGR